LNLSPIVITSIVIFYLIPLTPPNNYTITKKPDHHGTHS
jgi:hypothetical protein